MHTLGSSSSDRNLVGIDRFECRKAESLKLKTFLVISPESWHAHAVSKHHYAMNLARLGHLVFFLDPPDESLREFVLAPVDGHPNLTVVRGPKVAAGLRLHPPFLRRWRETLWLARLEKTIGCHIDSIWLFENSRFFDLRFAGDRLKIYHQVDLNQDFQPDVAAATADICFCTTDFIRERLLPHNARTYKIHHGLAAHVSQTELSDQQEAWFDQTGPHAVYIGNLDMAYLDAELLSEAARRFPAVRFHFVGGYSEQGALRTRARDLSNVTWWGKVGSECIEAILRRADVMLVAYQAARWRDQASPHKFMEYLASGKVVVATYTDEYKDKRHLLQMVDSNADYLDAFARVIDRLDEYNSPARQAERKAFAEEHSYERQLDRVFGLLRQHQLLPT